MIVLGCSKNNGNAITHINIPEESHIFDIKFLMAARDSAGPRARADYFSVGGAWRSGREFSSRATFRSLYARSTLHRH